MLREEWGKENEETVNRVMAAWLRGIEFMKDETNLQEVYRYMDEFYRANDLILSQESLAQDVKLITLYNLDEQIAQMERKGGPPPTSDYDFSTLQISQYVYLLKVLSHRLVLTSS